MSCRMVRSGAWLCQGVRTRSEIDSASEAMVGCRGSGSRQTRFVHALKKQGRRMERMTQQM